MTGTLAGVILAGGRATRMGGADKALLPLAGRPLIAHVVERLGRQTDRLLLSANGDPDRFSAFGLPVVADAGGARWGPLAGVLAGLDAAAALGAEAIVTAPVDSPFLPTDLAARLRAAAAAAGAPLAVAATAGARGAVRQPVFALWPVACAPELRAALSAGARKVGAVLDAQGCATALFGAGPPDPFFNVNAPEDLEEAERFVGGS